MAVCSCTYLLLCFSSDESMSSVAPLITIHATYPWQYHSVFHGCIIDKDRIQIGQIVKQGEWWWRREHNGNPLREKSREFAEFHPVSLAVFRLPSC